MSKLIFRTLAGSRLYGVATETSDYDYKGIFLEDLHELLQKERNVKTSSDGKTEEELFSLNYYMRLLSQGQVIPVDMLFAPPAFWTNATDAWEEIYQERKKFVSANIMPFVGYAKGQAMKYGLKGNKIKTIEKALELVKANIPFNTLRESLSGMEGVNLSEEITANRTIPGIDICGKTFGLTTDYKLWIGPLEKLLRSFGERAKQASEGVDLKAQYHTMRICYEAIELLETGELTFPRPEVADLIKIRKGEYNKEQLELAIETVFQKVKIAETKSTLQKQPDINRMNELVYTLQAKYLHETFQQEIV